MFGYITVNKDELKIKDYRKYEAYYCGVCHSLGRNYGAFGQMTLTYDMTFLAILLSSLYEDRTAAVLHRCVPHPVKKHEAIYNEYTDYAAAVNVMLSYYKLRDDWQDERSIKANMFSSIIKSAFNKAKGLYPRQAGAIEEYIKAQKHCENSGVTSPDEAAAPTGEMLASVFDFKQDEWQDNLRRMGFFLGKFIYIMDAFDDVKKDIKKNNYNPLIQYADEENFHSRVKEMLVMLAAESSKAFEALPVLDNADILRNIIYSGIWCRYNAICSGQKENKER